jgi:hypothetical protein
MNKPKGHSQAALTAIMKYCQAIEVIEWLDSERAYCGGDAVCYAFWFAAMNPTILTDDEVKFAASILFCDEPENKAKALKYYRDQLSGDRS